MRVQAKEQYLRALRAGQKYYRAAVSHGRHPYPPALDDIITAAEAAGYEELGVVDIPAELIAGTRSKGRTSAFAGNFMPLLAEKTEFASKWIALCDAHLSEEGIRDPVKCWEYLGRFYIEEGNKRVSVLLSFDAPSIPARVTRLIPRWSEEEHIRSYYAFMRFYALSGQYGVELRRPEDYERLQAKLGFDRDHVWSDEERRSFSAGFCHFRQACHSLEADGVTPAEALLSWLGIYPFSDIKTMPAAELSKRIAALRPDILAREEKEKLEVSITPSEPSTGVLSRILGAVRTDHVNAAFIYAFSPEASPWTRAHDCGRAYLEQHMGDRVTARTYLARDGDYTAALEEAAADGAELIFAINPSMIGACRRFAALHPDLKILNCGLAQPYPGVRTYYSRIHECKFITGAIAGAMTESNIVGFIAAYPILGTPASVNAFALGVRMTNPRARIKLAWSCLPGDPEAELLRAGADVISNRDAAGMERPFEIGTYKYLSDGSVMPLALPLWYWGEVYERIVLGVLSGAWNRADRSHPVTYWWGMRSGVLGVQLSPDLPDGLRKLAEILQNGLTDTSIELFRDRIIDQDGQLRHDGSRDMTPEELLTMDWFCDNVDGSIPRFDELIPAARETVRQLGLEREFLPPEKEQPQL